MRRLTFTAIVALVFAFCASSSSVAQSFDCKRAATTIEKIVCGDEGYEYENLRDVDAALGKAFSRRIQGVSAAESRRLLLEQRAWLARRLEVCHISPHAQLKELGPNHYQCLYGLYEERIAALNQKPIDLVYSGDARVCPRLHKAMNVYHERNPGKWSFLEKNALPTILELAGFESVRWLDSEDERLLEDAGGDDKLMIFEGEVFDGTIRFVVMSSSNPLATFLSYKTVVFILDVDFEKGDAIALRSNWKYANSSYILKSIYQVHFEEVSLALTFYGESISGPIYTLKKEVTFDSPLISFASDSGIAELAAEFRAYPFGAGEGAAQIPLEIDGRVYFFFGSEPFSEKGVLYRIASDFSVEIVCVTKGNTERYIPR